MPNSQNITYLSIRGMACGGCAAKLTSKFTTQFPHAKFSADFSSKAGVIIEQTSARAPLSEYLNFIKNCGYDVDTEQNSAKTESRRQLIKLAVAFFCFANIMTFALAEYFATTEIIPAYLLTFFRLCSAILASISVFYCASAILKNAVNAVQRLQPNVDFTIAVAIIVTYGYSLFSLLPAYEIEPYFDSVTALIFFLLGGRYLQQNFIRFSQNQIKEKQRLLIDFCTVERSGQISTISIHDLQKGDRLCVKPGEVVPVKSELNSAHGQISMDLISGESDPISVTESATIESGALCLNSPLTLTALESGTNSYLRKLCSEAFELNFQKSDLMNKSDFLASVFFILVIMAAVACYFTTLPLGINEALFRTVALLLIACPCAFAIALPLAASKCGFSSLSNNILFRNVNAMQRIADARTIIFDKTGTLSTGTVKVENVEWLQADNHDVRAILYQICSQSNHAVSKIIKQYLEEDQNTQFSRHLKTATNLETSETTGFGVEATWGTLHFKLGNARFCNIKSDSNSLWDTFFTNASNEIIARFQISEKLQSETLSVMTNLKKLDLEAYILSGDNATKSLTIAKKLAVAAENTISDSSPEAKALFLKNHPNAIMVGNGFNDALALSTSSVGISTANSDDISFRISDIHLMSPGIKNLDLAITLARQMNRNLKYAFTASVAYNCLGIAAAWLGLVTPVVAAIIMPINGIIVGLIATRGKSK